jgi:hypothetical protein
MRRHTTKVSVVNPRSLSGGALKFHTHVVWQNGVASSTKHPKTGGGDYDGFSLDDLKEALDEESSNIVRTRRSYVQAKRVEYDRKIITITDVDILDEDSMSNFKDKIYSATTIPPYRQHLWYELDGEIVSPCYILTRRGVMENINIRDIVKMNAYIMRIPVCSQWYSDRAEIYIHDRERSTIVGNICSSAKWYVVDINDFFVASREQFAAAIDNDAHMRDMVYYSFIMRFWPSIPKATFYPFVKNEKAMLEEYPQLGSPRAALTSTLKSETRISNYPIDPNLAPAIFISESDIQPINSTQSSGELVNITNLFDALSTDPKMSYIKARVFNNNRLTILTKQFKGGARPHVQSAVDVMSIMIYMTWPSIGTTQLHITNMGTYHVKTVWRENIHAKIGTIYHHTINLINPIIKKINRLGEGIVRRSLDLLDVNNLDIISSTLVINIARQINSAEFIELKKTLKKYHEANIINLGMSDSNNINFHFIKGMTHFDEARFAAISNTHNSYDRHISHMVGMKWDGIHIKQKQTNINMRTVDVRIRATNLKGSEYGTFIKYMFILFSNLPHTKTKTTSHTDKVAYLKESDPLLFDLRRVYNHPLAYSQICQKPNQPRLVPRGKKPPSNAVKYWNFTAKEAAYYVCPHAKYPNLYFKTGVHPNDYCLPCCKKAAPNQGTKLGDIYHRCLKDRSYIHKKKEFKYSRYIVSYGKKLYPARLSKLPVDSLSHLFYQQYSKDGAPLDDECVPDVGYYLYGAETPTMAGAIQNALQDSDFIAHTMSKISKSNKWSSMLGGSITNHFRTKSDLLADIHSTFELGKALTSFDMWNQLFKDIALAYWNIKVIQFIDSGGTITLSVETSVKHGSDPISNRHKYLIAVDTGSHVHPIYMVDIKKYNSGGDIMSRTFEWNDKVMGVIGNMMQESIVENATSANINHVIQFTQKTGAHITSIHTNTDDTAYAAIVDGKIYMPITNSSHDMDVVNDGIYDRSNSNMADMMIFVTAWNGWADRQPTIDMKHWLMLGDAIIGFDDGYLNYYFADETKSAALEIAKLPIIIMNCDPHIIQAAIVSMPISASTNKETAISLYNHWKYELFLLEFISVINASTNSKVRTELTKTIRNGANINKIHTILAEYPTDYELVVKFLDSFSSRCSYKPIQSKMVGYKPRTFNIEAIISMIKTARFDFDNITMIALQKMTHSNLITKLGEMMAPSIKIGTPNTSEFPHIMSSCRYSRADFCTNGKLIMTAPDLKLHISGLAEFILNTFKMNSFTTSKLITPKLNLRFIERPHENIHIQI